VPFAVRHDANPDAQTSKKADGASVVPEGIVQRAM
jgi:hypothetical protein